MVRTGERASALFWVANAAGSATVVAYAWSDGPGSVHAADGKLRSKIMPVNDRYPLRDILAECRRIRDERYPDGLPVGLQIVGRPNDEPTVLAIAHTYEQATPWHTRRPPEPTGGM